MAKKSDRPAGVVYSTEHGRMCPACGHPASACSCRRSSPTATTGDGVARISLETKGRKGKGVTLITGLPLGLEELRSLASRLKQRCGCGGTVKDGTIEIQGDHRLILAQELAKGGFKVKYSGG